MDEWVGRRVGSRHTIEKPHDLGMSLNPLQWNNRQKQQLDSTWCENYDVSACLLVHVLVRERVCVNGIFASQIESMCVCESESVFVTPSDVRKWIRNNELSVMRRQ